MRDSKWLTIITACVSIASLISVLLFYCIGNVTVGYDISLAIFGSSILGFIMSLIEYFAVKRKTMEIFYEKALVAISAIGKAKYFFTDEPVGLVVNCIAEEWSNKLLGKAPIHASKDKLIEAYKSCLDSILVNDPALNEHCETWYINKMQEYYKELEKCFDSYIEIANTEFGALDNAYGNLDFIFGNKTLRLWVYETLYESVKEIRGSAIREAYHFKLYKAGEGNISACTAFLLKLNQEWFLVKEIDNEDIHCVSVYRKHYDTLSDKVEEFRCKIYKQKCTLEEHLPTMSKIYNIRHKEEKVP